MMRYTWKRILTGIVSLFLLATVTFFLVRLIPGSPFQRGGVSEQVVEAVEYYKQFVQLSPNDNSKYILLYKIYEAQDISLEERIAVLKEYKKREYNEKWAYELAFLYHRVGLATECVEECDQLILWFGEGKYVLKAMELKRLYVPLSPAQQQLYDSQYGGRNAVEEEPQEAPAQEQTQAVRSAESKEKADLDIHVKPMDMGQYNTINLQEALAASMRDVFAVDREEVKTASPEQEEPDLMKNQQTVYAAENRNGEYQEDISRVLEESDQWDAQATGQLDMEETKLAADAVDAAEPVSVQPTQSTPQVYADVEPTLPVASSSGECAYVAEPVNAQPEAPILAAQPAPEQTPAVTDPADAGIKNIIAPYDRNILRNVYPHFVQRINGTYGHHVILSCDSRKFLSFLEKFHGQLVAHGILGIHPRDLSVIGLICRLDEHMILFSLFFKLADKALHTLGALPLPSG